MVEVSQSDKVKQVVEENWDNWYIPALMDFIRVPNLTLMVDEEFLTNGLTEKAMAVVDEYAQKLNIQGLERHIIKPEGKSNMIIYVVESEGPNIMFYGHLDKQPHCEGWDADKHPTEPSIKDNWMFGRGGADDGYSVYSCLLAIKSAQASGKKLPRVVIVLETEEESGSPNLLFLLDQGKDIIKVPDYCICLDSGALDYDSLWLTSSLRGVVIIDVKVKCGQLGYHSGISGGIIPDTFRIVRQLLDRVDDPKTGKIIGELQTEEAPEWKVEEAKKLVEKYGMELATQYKVVDGLKYMNQDDLVEMYLDNVWRPNLSITGAGGLPPLIKAGNVNREFTTVRLSLRLSPTQSPKDMEEKLIRIIKENPPYNCEISVSGDHSGSGWCQKTLDEKLTASLNEAGANYFGKPVASYGLGFAIPFLKELEGKYPSAQIVAMGVLGPDANAHGPNEGINLDFVKKLTCTLGYLLTSFSS